MKSIILFLFIYLRATASSFSPFSLAPLEVTTTSISVEWSTLNDVNNYFIATIAPLEEEQNTEAVKYVNTTSAVWINLIPGKNYTISVVAQNDFGETSQPAVNFVTTKPMPPYRIRVSKFVNPILTEYKVGINQTMKFPVYGAVIMWEGPDIGFFDGFEITVSPPDGLVRLPIVLKDGEAISQAKKRRRIIWDLVPGVYYDFTVQTRSYDQLSTPANAFARIPPEIPGVIKTSDLTPRSLTLSWKEPHRGILDGFVVELDPPEGRVIKSNNLKNKWRQIENLTPGTIYKVDVYSISFNVLSFQPRSSEFKTPPAPPQGPVQSSNVTRTSVIVQWKKPEGKLDYYEIVYFPTLYDVGRLRHRVQDPIVRLSFLDAATEYSLIVYAVSNKLYSKPLRASVFTVPVPTKPSSTVKTEPVATSAVTSTTVQSIIIEKITINTGSNTLEQTDAAGGSDTTSTRFTTTKSQTSTTVEPSTMTTTSVKTTQNQSTTKQLSSAFTTTASLSTNHQETTSTTVATTKESPASTKNIFKTTKSAQETTTGLQASTKKQTTTAETAGPLAIDKTTKISTAFSSIISTTFEVGTTNFPSETTFFATPFEKSLTETTPYVTVPLTTSTRNKSDVTTTTTKATNRNVTSENETAGFSNFSPTSKSSFSAGQTSTTLPSSSDVSSTVSKRNSESFTTPFDIALSTFSSSTLMASHPIETTELLTSRKRGSTQYSGDTTQSADITTRLTTFSNSFDPISTETSRNPPLVTTNTSSVSSFTDTTYQPHTVSTTKIVVDTTTTPVDLSTTITSTRAGATSIVDSSTHIDGSSSTELFEDSTTWTNQVSTDPDPFVRVASENNVSTPEVDLLSAHTTNSPADNSATEPKNKATVGVGVRIIPGPAPHANQTSTPSVSQTKTTTTENTIDNATNGGGVLVINTDGNADVIKKGVSTICKPDNITVFVDKEVIGLYERDYGPLHLNEGENEDCIGVEHDSYYRYTIAPNILDCGTTIELNETHVNFTNSVSNSLQRDRWLSSLADSSGVVMFGSRLSQPVIKFIHMKIWCTFPLDLNVTSIYPFLPQLTLQVLNFNISGHGEFSAVMRLYKNSSYNEAYLHPPTINSSDMLYVGISLLDTTDESTFMVVRKCWATPGRSPEHLQRYPIIRDSCAVEDSLDGSVQIHGNGKSRSVKWEGHVFKFVAFNEVWLHCEIRICFGEECQPTCRNTRKKRSLNGENGSAVQVLSAGPISLNTQKQVDNTPIVPHDVGRTDEPYGPFSPETTIVIVIIVLSAIILICCITIIFILARLRRKRSRPKHSPEIASSTSFPLPLVKISSDFDDFDDEALRQSDNSQTLGSEWVARCGGAAATVDEDSSSTSSSTLPRRRLDSLQNGILNQAYGTSEANLSASNPSTLNTVSSFTSSMSNFASVNLQSDDDII